MFNWKDKLGRILGKGMTFLAMNAVFLSEWNSNCLIILGEPQIPDVLVEMKKEKFDKIDENNYL